MLASENPFPEGNLPPTQGDRAASEGRVPASDSDVPAPEGARISSEWAVEAARSAAREHVEVSEDAEVRIEEADDTVAVEFLRTNAPGERGPDYEARVLLDARTGEVVQILGG